MALIKSTGNTNGFLDAMLPNKALYFAKQLNEVPTLHTSDEMGTLPVSMFCSLIFTRVFSEEICCRIMTCMESELLGYLFPITCLQIHRGFFWCAFTL